MSNKHKICDKVKNPCKICLGKVTAKTGLQCCGACQSWVHYKCSNYTPGKIQDIKKGIIKVNCPCPDCETKLPKEYRTDKKLSCANLNCPANRPLSCENKSCPVYEGAPAGFQDSMNQVPSAAQWPGTKCGVECKKFPAPEGQNAFEPVPPQPPMMPTKMPIPAGPRCGRPECKLHNPQEPMYPGAPQGPMYPPMAPQGQRFEAHDCQNSNRPPVGDTGMQQDSSFNSMPAINTVEQLCNTVGILSKQLNDLMMNMKQGMMQRGGGGGGAFGGAAGGAGAVAGTAPCPNSAPCPPITPAPCVAAGTRANCPKPCNCPGNPSSRRK